MLINKILLVLYVILHISDIAWSQYFHEDYSRRLHERRRRPSNNDNNNYHNPCGRFLGLAYINVENTYNCGTGNHHVAYGGIPGISPNFGQGGGNGGHHKPHRPFANHGSNGGHGGHGGHGNGGNGPFSNLFANINGGSTSGDNHGVESNDETVSTGTGSNGGGAAIASAFGGLVNNLASNIGPITEGIGNIGNNIGNAFNNLNLGGSNTNNNKPAVVAAEPDPVQDEPEDEVANNSAEPAPVYENKLPNYSLQLYPSSKKPLNNYNNNGFFFGLFDGSIINSFFNRPKPTYRPQTSHPEFTLSTLRPTHNNNYENIKPVHEDYDPITEAYSFYKPVFAKPPANFVKPINNLKPGQYISVYDSFLEEHDILKINPKKIVKQLKKDIDDAVDFFLL